MKKYTGSILEINKNNAVVMTDSCNFVTIHPQPDMFVGQQIKFRKSDIKKSNQNYIKYFALAASVFVIGLCSFIFLRFSNLAPVLAYIDVDINPSIELTIDNDAEVIDIKALNEDAQIVLKDLDLMDLHVKEAITEVVTVSKKLGYLNNDRGNTVLISASLEENTDYAQNDSNLKTLDKVLTDISSININVENKNVKPEVIKVTPNSRKAAIEKGLSMGRYALFSKIKAENSDITVEKAKTERISEMLVKAKIKSDKSESKSSGSGSNNTDILNPKSNEPNKLDSNESNVKNNDSNSTNSNSKGNYTKKPLVNNSDKQDTKPKKSEFSSADQSDTGSKKPDFKDPAPSHSGAKKSDISSATPNNKDKKSDVKEPSSSEFGSKKSDFNDSVVPDNGAKKSDSSSATPNNRDKKSDVKEPPSSEFGSKKSDFENPAPSDGKTNKQSPKDPDSKGHSTKNAGSK